MLTTDQQSVLDDLYWNTSRTLRSIAEEIGLASGAEVTASVTPLPAGGDCWWCRQPITFGRRTERRDALSRWRIVRCACGAPQPNPSKLPDLLDTPATILLPAPGEHRLWELESILQSGIDALARCGLRWTGEYACVDVTGPPDRVVNSLESLVDKFVVVPALRYLATNDGDALALFFRLVMDGWRVITSARPGIGKQWQEEEWYDGLVPGRGSGY